jgi:hypothetical protein
MLPQSAAQNTQAATNQKTLYIMLIVMLTGKAPFQNLTMQAITLSMSWQNRSMWLGQKANNARVQLIPDMHSK